MRLIWLIGLLIFTFQVQASQCVGRLVNPVTDICWSCLFPLTLGSANLYSSHVPDLKNPTTPMCACQGIGVPRPGLAVGFWEPAEMVEVVRKPYCFPSLGGVMLGPKSLKHAGEVNFAEKTSFYQVHVYRYPVLSLLDLIDSGHCTGQKSFDVAWMTELDPAWQDDALTAILNPEAMLFGNQVAQASCAADCTAASTHLASDKLFWCAGCHGSIYPLNGHVQAHVSGVQASSLLTARVLFKLHRLGLEMGTDTNKIRKICKPSKRPLMHKSAYRTQMVYPVVAKQAKRGGCEPMGRSSVLWEQMKNFPIKGEDFSYVIWKKRNCCAM